MDVLPWVGLGGFLSEGHKFISYAIMCYPRKIKSLFIYLLFIYLLYEEVKKACDHQRKNNIKKGRNGHSEQYSQMIAMTIKALVGVTSCEFLNRDKGSLTVLYRSTLMVNRLKIEMGIAIMYTTCQTMQNTLPWFHLLLRKSASISHETVWRSLPRENLKEPRKK